MATLFWHSFTNSNARQQRKDCSARKHRRAFTLLEGMVVVTVLAVLVGLGTAAISRARNSTSMVRCISNLRLIGQGFNNYAFLNQGRLPYIPSGTPQWEDLMVTAGLKRDTHFQCPVDQEIYPMLGSSYDWRDLGPPDAEHRDSLAGKQLLALRPELVMSYEIMPGWHKSGFITTVLVDGSISVMDYDSFDVNLHLNALNP